MKVSFENSSGRYHVGAQSAVIGGGRDLYKNSAIL